MITLLDRKIKSAPTPNVVKKPVSDTADNPRPVPPYAVVLHNDNLNTCEFVVFVLMKVFKYSVFKSYKLMFEAQFKGRCIIWIGPKEEAEKNMASMIACGPDPIMRTFGAKPLRVTVETVPE